MSSPRLSASVKNAILDAYKRGVKMHDISKRFDVHHSYPSILVKRRGLPLRRPRI